jgi:uncharacterized protein
VSCGNIQLTQAQVPPSQATLAAYSGLHAVARNGTAQQVVDLLAQDARSSAALLSATDNNGRTPLHVAAFQGNTAVMRALVNAGADANALEDDRYDLVTIAAVANDLATLNVALKIGCDPRNVPSRYDGAPLMAPPIFAT